MIERTKCYGLISFSMFASERVLTASARTFAAFCMAICLLTLSCCSSNFTFLFFGMMAIIIVH